MSQNQLNSVNITLTQQQLNVISSAFALAPYGQVAPLVAEINRQIQEQIANSDEVRE